MRESDERFKGKQQMLKTKINVMNNASPGRKKPKQGNGDGVVAQVQRLQAMCVRLEGLAHKSQERPRGPVRKEAGSPWQCPQSEHQRLPALGRIPQVHRNLPSASFPVHSPALQVSSHPTAPGPLSDLASLLRALGTGLAVGNS